MNERIKILRERALKREYKRYRDDIKSEEIYSCLVKKLHDSDMSDTQRMTYRFEYLMKNEGPVILDDEKFVFTRTITKIPDIYSENEMSKIKAGYVCNICPDYADIIEKGLYYNLSQIETAEILSGGKSEYGDYLARCINAIIDLTARYKKKSKRTRTLGHSRNA